MPSGTTVHGDAPPEPPDEPDAPAPAAARPVIAPYVAAATPMPVTAIVRGEQRNGEVLGWRGDRVYVRHRSAAGNHLSWLPASDVHRTLPP